MIRSFLALSALTSAVLGCTLGSNHTCLEVTLWDFFGDGWNGAKLYVEFPDGHVESAAPTCDYQPVHWNFCPETSGTYFMINIEENNTLPQEYWEIFWTAKVEYCNASEPTLFYTGGYNTTMVWEYDADSDKWSLHYSDNLWPNEDTCEGCGDARACKPKPKPKRDDKDKKDKPKDKPDKDDDKNVTESEDIDGDEFDAPKYGPPAVNVAVTMFSDEGDGWFQTNYHGARWYIFDAVRTHVFFSGTLCDGFNGRCKICLGDGSYVYRVTGFGRDDEDFDRVWDFCGVTGTYQEELTFHIKKGKCYPDVLRNVSQICADSGEAYITLGGVLAVAGMSTELFSSSDASVLFGALGSEVTQWSSNDIKFVSSVLDSASVLNGRKLGVYTHDVSFTVGFDAKAFNVDGFIFSNVQELTSQIREFLESKIDNGEFLSDISSQASALNVPMMNSVQGVALTSLEVLSVEYKGTQKFVYSTLPAEEGKDYAVSYSSKFDVASVAIFFSALAVGFIAFVGIMSKGMTGYKQLAQESQHGALVEEVMPTEDSEHNFAPRVSRKEDVAVEATI